MANDMIFSGVDNKPINTVMERVYESPMDNVREGAEDIHVRSYIAYGNTEDNKLYLEPTYATQVSQADVAYAFARGMLTIVEGTTTLVPIAMTENKVTTVGGTTSATLVEWVAKAST